ncbi:hypothetical protein FEM48_Zijuj11G0141600 [Ziziphus jujuba var. spinosa]|uniref:Uncharacterized protein n=1 Tax=Ziziphus jujuba var. spinosa TaxID=714518 RepID=A0A978UJE1_ZIZJJ|nr:hypothetical protein FEM48_Zijuj11G0141600 [Ziziphus jujuba var. spinosa]
MKHLKELDISRCQKLEKLPEIPEDCTSSSLGYLNITGLAETRFELNFKTNNINSDGDCFYKYDGSLWPHIGSTDEDHVLIRCHGFDLESAFGAKWFSICSNFTQVSIGMLVEGKDVKWEIKKCGFKLLNGRGSSKRRLDDDPNIKFQEEMKNLGTQRTVSFELDDMFRFILLVMHALVKLLSFSVSAGAMACLEEPSISHCQFLEKVPSDIEHLTKLKVLVV